MLSIQNRMKRLWTVPATFKPDGSAAFEHVNLPPGESGFVHDEHWAQVSKGNKVIEALVTERSLVVSKSKKADLEVDELANPASPVAPEELTAKDERAHIESHVELKEITLDEPASGKSDRKAR